MQTKKPPKPFSIESLIGDRKSPEIDIENNISEHSRNSDEDDRPGLDQMRYYLNTPFLQQSVNFPFLLGYPEPWLSRVFGSGVPPQITQEREEKRDSPVSVGSEVDSDGVDDNNQG